MTTVIVLLSIALVISFGINIIQYRRQVQLEASIDEIQFDEAEYITFFDKLYIGINHAYSNIVRIDKSEAFRNDDEVGFTFNSILKIVNDLNQFMDDAKARFEEEEKK